MIAFDAAFLRDYDAALAREWLQTNGRGGYAGSSLLGANTRRYHALLVEGGPALARNALFSRVDALASYRGRTFDLTTQCFRNGGVEPMGYLNLESFRLEGRVPVWTWRCDDARIEQRVVLAWGKNSVYVAFRVIEASAPVTLRLRLLHALRDHHAKSAASDPPTATALAEGGFRLERGGLAFALRWDEVERWEPNAAWLKGIFWPEEAWRGYTDSEALFQFGDLQLTLNAGEAWQVAATSEPDAAAELSRRWDEVQAERDTHEAELWARAAPRLGGDDAPAWLREAVLAADQFLVTVERGGPQRTMLAGYHWFTDWGRDTMIALPGLCLATGRADEAAALLCTFARYVERGMLPNRFPDAGEEPEYNSADGTLWLFEALGQTWRATGDDALLAELMPALREIVHWHQRGTRYGIRVDDDGLLVAGEAGTQLTWMDVKIGDEVPTPRHGKAVELSALWYNALRWMATFERAIGAASPEPFDASAGRTAAAFERFWNPATGHLFDVLDRDGEDDPTLRPNQLLALSLTHPVLNDAARARSVIEACEQALLTPVGLRTLPTDDPAYHGQHVGPRENFDRAYHNGTVWAWLIGPYLRAQRHLARLDGRPPPDRAARLAALDGLARHLLHDGAVGSVSEIFDGDAPHAPRGCVAQAWSVAELLAAGFIEFVEL